MPTLSHHCVTPTQLFDASAGEKISTNTSHYSSYHDTEKGSKRWRRKRSLMMKSDPLRSLNKKLDFLARQEAPHHARLLYQRIAALYNEGYYPSRPDLVSFNTVLKSFQDDPEGALEFWEQEAHQVEPTVRSYNAFLLALAKTGLSEQAETLLRHMQAINSKSQPDLISYNTVLLAYRNSANVTAAAQAQKILEEMIASDSIQPDAISFNTVMAAWVSRRNKHLSVAKAEECLQLMERNNIRPDVYSYTTLIQAYSQFEGASQQCLQKLRDMEGKNMRPNKITYTTVLLSLCRDKQMHLAASILEEMWARNDPDVLPDVVTYSALIDGWASVASELQRSAVDATFVLLEQMQRQGIVPNDQTYTCVLSAISHAGQTDSGDLAWSVIKKMRAHHIPVTVIHYNVALDAYSRSTEATKVVDASRMWQEMLDSGIRCDTITYNSLMSVACRRFLPGDVRKDALDLALSAFRALQNDSDCEPNSLTFSYLFRSLRMYAPPSERKSKAIKQVFHQCCNHGCLNHRILEYLQEHVCSDDEFRELLGDNYQNNLQFQDLPKEWSRYAFKDNYVNKFRVPTRYPQANET